MKEDMRSFNFPERDYMFRIHNTTIFAGSQAIYLKKAHGELKIFNGSKYRFSEKITFYFIDSIDIFYAPAGFFMSYLSHCSILLHSTMFCLLFCTIIRTLALVFPTVCCLPAFFCRNLCQLFPEKNHRPAFPSLIAGKDRPAFCSHSGKRNKLLFYFIYL